MEARAEPVINRQAPRCVPVAKPTLGTEEAVAAARTVESGWLSSGPRVVEFEGEFAAAHGKQFGVCVNSGTSALLLALKAAGIEKNSRVLLPTMGMVACANAIVQLGATPVFGDSEPHTGNICQSWLRRVGRVDAIMPIHLYGIPAERFIEQCHDTQPGVPIIEDCCEAHYGRFSDGQTVGSRGCFACFSFFANKIVCAGEGGIILTDDEQAAERMKSLRSHAFSKGCHFQHSELAYGLRWTDLQASIALVQHRRRHELLAARERIYQRYRQQLTGVHHVKLQPDIAGAARWVFPVTLPNEDMRDRLRAHLAAAGIETRSFFVPLHRQVHLRQFADAKYPTAEMLSETGCYLPLFADMTDDDLDYICNAVNGAFE